jgi:hypothetical protein
VKALIALVLVAAVAHADPPKLQRIDPPPGAREQAIGATVVAGIFLGATIFSSVRASQRTQDHNDLFTANAPESQQAAAIASADHWHDATYAFAAVTLVTVVVTGYLWTRAQPTYQVAAVPTAGGGMVGFTSSW